MRKRIFFWTPLAILVILYFFGGKLGFFPGTNNSPSSSDNGDSPADKHIQVDASGEAGYGDSLGVKAMSGDSNDQSLARTDTPSSSQPAADSGPRVNTAKSEVLHLLIDDRELFIAGAKRPGVETPNWQPISLAEAVARAGQLRDNPEFRVLISRKGSSRVSTEQELLDALRQVGIAADEIHLEERLTP